MSINISDLLFTYYHRLRHLKIEIALATKCSIWWYLR